MYIVYVYLHRNYMVRSAKAAAAATIDSQVYVLADTVIRASLRVPVFLILLLHYWCNFAVHRHVLLFAGIFLPASKMVAHTYRGLGSDVHVVRVWI